jgi:hypothetical protein
MFIQIILVAFFLLLIGDFLATFIYHVPEHVFGKYHTIVHHSPNRSFIRYAIASRCPQALIYGFLGFAPYLISLIFLWQISLGGAMLGLILAELHVLWRHSSEGESKTPPIIARFCSLICITTPERHWLHHKDSMSAYGDIFTFYDLPAQAWLKFLTSLRKKKIQKIGSHQQI